jgi:aryl-alcohol dehydrogenase-like predicted oxidoreductase
MAAMRSVGPFGVFGLCLGTNVFGWTVSERDSHAVLDAYVAAGGNFLDTADSYSHWADGHAGGESEAILGAWLSRPGRRERVVLATKVGNKPGLRRLDRPTMTRALDASLARLRTDVVDLWFLHRDDPGTPLEETAGALAELRRAGKIRAYGVSNFTPARIDALIDACTAAGAPPPIALQPHYNLMDRDLYEGEPAAAATRHHLAALPYFGLARGFLTGKYRPGGPPVCSPRAPHATAYLRELRGPLTLRALDAVAAERAAPVAAVALAWLAQQPTVAAPIASARSVGQLRSLLPMATLTLTADELALLARAADGTATAATTPAPTR